MRRKGTCLMKRNYIAHFAGGITALLLAVCLTGCGEIKTEDEITKWANDRYDIRTELLDSKKTDDGIHYTLKSKEGVVFEAVSKMTPFGLDGETTFFEYADTQSNYYEALYEFLAPEIEELEEEYGVKFILTYYGGYTGAIYTAVYADFFDYENPREDLIQVSQAVAELAWMIHPTEWYDPSGGDNRIFLAKDPEGTEYSDWYFMFTEQEAGKIGNYAKDFFETENETHPEIREDAISWGAIKYPGFSDYRFRFFYPKSLAEVECLTETGETGNQYYIDVEEYNRLYEKYDGTVPEDEFGNCVMSKDEVDFPAYCEKSEEEKE